METKAQIRKPTGINIKIAQLNAMRSKLVLEEIKRITDEEQFDVVCLQEPYTKNGTVPGMPQHARIIVQGEKPAAAIIIFTRDITVVKINQLCDEHMICVEIITPKISIILANLYFQFREEIEPYLHRIQKVYNTYNNRPIIFMMDANAKSELWHSKITDNRGEALSDLLEELQIEILNKPNNPHTFKNRAGAYSNIDITAISGNYWDMVKNWMVCDNLTISDHNLIKFEIK